jgi:hypothetical protein
MKGLRLLAAIVGVTTSIGCWSPALAGWHNNGTNWRERALYDGRSMSVDRLGPAGQTPVYPQGSTPLNPAGSTPVPR